jgi:uncharacterized OB-fold protein
MSYLPSDFAVPAPLPHEVPFWEYCERRELRIQQCASCGRFRHPPQPVCALCRSTKSQWTQVGGDGEVYTYTIVHHAATPSLREAVPYNVAIVLLDGADDVRLTSNVIDVPPGEMRVGLRVKLAWETAGGRLLPRFRKADG